MFWAVVTLVLGFDLGSLCQSCPVTHRGPYRQMSSVYLPLSALLKWVKKDWTEGLVRPLNAGQCSGLAVIPSFSSGWRQIDMEREEKERHKINEAVCG